ncbi:MAG: VCBS repeat-containing protein, partial [Pseudomonadota bacterium]
VPGRLDREKALAVGKDLQVDYVILGSLTVFGESVSIDAKILDVAKAEELVTAFSQSKGMDEVIPTVNRFAADINEKIMGRAARPSLAGPAQPEEPKGPGGLVGAGESFEGKGLGHVQRFRMEIISLDVGDVDGDGKNELVFISRDTVHVYKWKEKTFALLKAVKGGWGSNNYVYVSVADINKNGRAEIYVTNLGASDVSSFVLEWQGSDLKPIAESQPWFLRVTDIPAKGATLIGQARKTGGFYHGDVHQLKWDGNRLVAAESLALPRRTNVFNFVTADFGAAGRGSTVLLDEFDYLRFFSSGGEELWKSDDPYGGTVTYMGDEDTTGETWKFFPSPLYITDVDGDGEPEVMVCKNTSKTGRFFAKFRYFASGAVQFMTWDRASLTAKWTSKKQPGPIVGYRVADVDNDGLGELVIASVTKEDQMIGKPRSQIAVYDLK